MSRSIKHSQTVSSSTRTSQRTINDALEDWLRRLGGARANAACTPDGAPFAEGGRSDIVEGEAASAPAP